MDETAGYLNNKKKKTAGYHRDINAESGPWNSRLMIQKYALDTFFQF